MRFGKASIDGGMHERHVELISRLLESFLQGIHGAGICCEKTRVYQNDNRRPPPSPRLPKSADSMELLCLDSMLLIRVSICQSLRLPSHGKQFLEGLITGGENWVLYDSNAHRAV
ncbi:unnamed protein product [Heligmosomoides polygyrus]|uniref:BTB/POZ domain-containing protein n=1 Tax=Heligmosomoides polygyrus TaxID=6339 RepID=A0A183FMQ9_HELPZ|nr:unnamed protein product [Heligmosomoides polygyrus]